MRSANHDAACCCDGCLVTSIIACKASNGIASPMIQVRIAGICFHGVNYALQGGVQKDKGCMRVFIYGAIVTYGRVLLG